MTYYAVGHNIAGYLPEADVTACGSWDDARAFIMAEMQYAADAIEAGAPDPFGETYAENLEAELQDLNLTTTEPQGGWSTMVETGEGPFHLPQSWWAQIITAEDYAEMVEDDQ